MQSNKVLDHVSFKYQLKILIRCAILPVNILKDSEKYNWKDKSALNDYLRILNIILYKEKAVLNNVHHWSDLIKAVYNARIKWKHYKIDKEVKNKFFRKPG